jgi:hypothetical protein
MLVSLFYAAFLYGAILYSFIISLIDFINVWVYVMLCYVVLILTVC